MSSQGLPTVELSDAAAGGLSVAVITSSWNSEICDRLHTRAVATARAAGADVAEFRVIGALELPVVAQAAARNFDAVVVCGCVIKGETPHFEYVCDSVTAGLTRIALDEATPIGNGVLTTYTLEQAIARSGGEGALEDKGAEAALAAMHTAVVLRELNARR